ncbi:hypothetical protein BGZ50_007312, partial [Haplosporangium sp. Z 11]
MNDYPEYELVDIPEDPGAVSENDQYNNDSQQEVPDQAIPSASDTEPPFKGQEDTSQPEPTVITVIINEGINGEAAEQESDAIVEALAVASDSDSSIPSTEHFSDTPHVAVPSLATTVKWYFVPDPENNYDIGTGDENQTVAMFKCHTGYQPPMRIDSNMCSAEWEVDISTLPRGTYEAIFGVSTQNFHHDKVESITFQLFGEEWCEGCQIIRGEKLQRMWVLELYYMELRLNKPKGYQDEASLIAHQPYLWSLDVRTIGPILDGNRQHLPTRIRSFGISGDGRYAATLASTNDDSIHLLIMWALPDMIDRRASASHDSKNHEKEIPTDRPSHGPRACAVGVITTLSFISRSQDAYIVVSVSWNGSKIAVGERAFFHYGSTSKIFSIYNYKQDVQHNKIPSLPAASTTMTALQPSTAHQQCTDLEGFCGYGFFQLTSGQDPDVKNEIFIARDEERILVYRMHPQWKLLHTISIASGSELWRKLGQHNKYLAAMEEYHSVISVWDIVQGSITSFADAGWNDRTFMSHNAAFSNDGKIMAVYTSSSEGGITSYWTATGTALGTYVPPHESSNIIDFQFTKDDSRILVSLGCDHHKRIQATTWVILETASMTVVDNIFIPQSFNGYNPLVPGSDTTFYLSHGTSLDLVPIYIQPRIACTDRCLKNLTPLDDLTTFDDRLIIITKGQPTSFTTPSGLNYHFEFQSPSIPNGDVSIAISISDKDNASTKALRIPTCSKPSDSSVYFVIRTSLQLVFAPYNVIIMWQLPLSFDDDLKLEVVRHFSEIQRCMICEHCELYSVDDDWNQEQKEATPPCHIDRHLGFKTAGEIIHLARLLHPSDPPIRKTILQYVCPHVNGYYDPEHPSDTLMATICRRLAFWFDQPEESFLQELLAFPGMRWILRPDTSMESNPIWICLDNAETESRFMRLVESLINYCFRQARTKKELGFLFPVLQCLHVLIDHKGHHTMLAAQVLQRFGYLPVKHREYIIDQRTIAHPPEFFLKFWKPIERPLYRCKDPVMQLASNYKEDPPNKNFTRQVHIAPFALLWQYDGDTVYKPESISAWSMTRPSWIRMLFEPTWYKCKPAAKRHVQCHKFALEMLNNPAIAALIEYK